MNRLDLPVVGGREEKDIRSSRGGDHRHSVLVKEEECAVLLHLACKDMNGVNRAEVVLELRHVAGEMLQVGVSKLPAYYSACARHTCPAIDPAAWRCGSSRFPLRRIRYPHLTFRGHFTQGARLFPVLLACRLTPHGGSDSGRGLFLGDRRRARLVTVPAFDAFLTPLSPDCQLGPDRLACVVILLI